MTSENADAIEHGDLKRCTNVCYEPDCACRIREIAGCDLPIAQSALVRIRDAADSSAGRGSVHRR
jgi:hypothetical protein